MCLLEKGNLKYPKDLQEWREIVKDFENKWNFSNCLGAVDGKHVIYTSVLPMVGLYITTTKKFHSVVLMAVVDAND